MKNIKRFRKPLVLLSLALVLALVWTTGASTYARYITTKEVSKQTATVAKWGFIVSANTENLFKTEYYKHGVDNTLATVFEKEKENENGNEITGTLCVSAKSDGTGETTNVVAPGTTGSMTFTIGGTAEVLSQLSINMAVTSDVFLTKGDIDDISKMPVSSNPTYYPIVWTLTKSTDTDFIIEGNLNEILNKMNVKDLGLCGNNNTIMSTNGVIQPNTTILPTTFTLTWKWAFEASTTDENRLPGGFGISVDEADTYLGYFSNGGAALTEYKKILEANHPSISFDNYKANTTVSFSLIITIAQIQKEA